jgi:hypothetical protein
MPTINTNKFRHEAEDCRRNARQAANPIDRESWLRLADDWMKLARDEEDLRTKIASVKMAARFHRD